MQCKQVYGRCHDVALERPHDAHMHTLISIQASGTSAPQCCELFLAKVSSDSQRTMSVHLNASGQQQCQCCDSHILIYLGGVAVLK